MQNTSFKQRFRRALAHAVLAGLAGACLATVGGARLDAQARTQIAAQASAMQFESGLPLGYRNQPYALDTSSQPVEQGISASGRIFAQTIRVPGAQWLRLTFAEATLGPDSYIQITSLKDGGRQQLDAESLKLWGNTSAFFNGDAVTFELFAAPDDANARVRIENLWYGDPALLSALATSGLLPPGTDGPVSLCGPDNRVASTESRVGRL